MSIVWKTNDIIADITTAYCHNRSKCIQPDQCEICKTDHNTDTLWFKNGIFWYLVPCFLVIFFFLKTSYKIQTGVPTFVVISLHSTKVCSFVVPASYLFFYTVQLQFQTIKCTYAPYLSLKADMKFLQKYNSS